MNINSNIIRSLHLLPLILILILGVISCYFMGCTGVTQIPGNNYNKAFHDSIDKKILDTLIANHIATHKSLGGIYLDSIKTSPSGLRFLKVSDTGAIKGMTLTGFSNVTFSYSIRIPGVPGIVDSVPTLGLSAVGYTVNPLRSTFPGLVEGIEQIHQGGHILLFIPSSIAFQDRIVNLSYLHADQTQTQYTVQPNSILIYNLTLTSASSF